MRSRNETTLVILNLVAAFFMMAGAAAAQGISPIQVAGNFTLPFEAQWGKMALPAGDYTFHFGTDYLGAPLVVVRGSAKGSPQGLLVPMSREPNSGSKNVLVCVRAGNAYVIRALELPAIERTLTFALPRGAEILAQEKAPKAQKQVGEVRVPVKLSGM